MATLLDRAVVAYETIAIPVSNSRPNPYAIFFYCPDVQLTNIRLWGVGRFYRLRTTPLGLTPTVLQVIELRAIGERLFPTEVVQTGANDGVQFIPTYDLSRVVIVDNAA